MKLAAAAGADRPRHASLDMVRGVAILAMVVYHFSWDLTFFGLADFRIFEDPAWIWFARCIAGTFLFVMGVAQVMARRRGLSAPAFWRRFALVAGCAAAISAATWAMDPETFIFFGILHHMALAALLIVPCLRLPTVGLAALALFCFAAPDLLTGPAFGHPLLAWTGLAPYVVLSSDFVPLFPWFGVALAGAVTGRAVLRDGRLPPALDWSDRAPPARALRLAGRYSLLIYMVHQPLLFGGLYLLTTLTMG
ncbi:MAG: DUF1624 domain-containing protein [Hyphomicrobiales bacterium]|nr:DUF1624 domain-containing protein [Hyphomicrobiales bacterium]MCP5374063.1 DUF1624 domain-containing protein [Hyphomicrobiales bacterium]